MTLAHNIPRMKVERKEKEKRKKMSVCKKKNTMQCL
jgi:hypothetical protein